MKKILFTLVFSLALFCLGVFAQNQTISGSGFYIFNYDEATSNGSWTVTIPAGFTASFTVQAWGAGGAGGCSGTSAKGGGGGGGYIESAFNSSGAGEGPVGPGTYPIVVGKGGTDGGGGGESSFNFIFFDKALGGGGGGNSGGTGGSFNCSSSCTLSAIGGNGGAREGNASTHAGGGGGGSGPQPNNAAKTGKIGAGGTGGAGGVPNGAKGGDDNVVGGPGTTPGGGGGGRGEGAASCGGKGGHGRVIINVSGLLPIELLSFNSILEDNGVMLTWQTASELNNEKFIIECSTDGMTYKPIGEVMGSGTTTVQQDYRFMDNSPLPGINYYRLKQMDFDGSFEYSPVTAANVERSNGSTLLSNPVSNELQIDLTEVSDAGYHIMIFNAMGALVKTGEMEPGSINISIPVADLTPGNYYVKIVGAGTAVTHKWVKL